MTARAIAAAALLATLAGAEARAQSASADGGATVPGNEGTAPTATPPPAATTAPDSRVSRRPEAVDITVVGGGDAFVGLRARVGDRLPLGVPLLWNRIDRFNPLTELLRGAPPPHPTSTLRCWIDLANLRHATLYFADQRGERFLVRELPLSGRFDEVDQQSVAQVMELSVSALIENAEIGFSRAQARDILARAQPPEPVVAVAPPAESTRWHPAAGIFYALEISARRCRSRRGRGCSSRSDVSTTRRPARRGSPAPAAGSRRNTGSRSRPGRRTSACV